MKVGDKVKLKITQHPYEREGVIVSQKGWICLVEVKYKSGYTMLFKRNQKQLELLKG